MEDTSTTIASQVAVCLASFNTLQEAIGDESQQPNGRSLRIAAEDSNGRFRVWSGNIGAHQNGTMKSSLDYRLRDAGYIKIRFIRLLKDLNMLLLDGESCLLEHLSLSFTPRHPLCFRDFNTIPNSSFCNELTHSSYPFPSSSKALSTKQIWHYLSLRRALLTSCSNIHC